MKTFISFTCQLTLVLFIGLFTFQAQAQDPSSILDLESTTQGVLVPRMATAERTAIVTPAQSLMVYDTDTKSFWYYKDTAWSELGAGGGATDMIEDADGDTKIQVEESADEDIIRFDLGGTELLTLTRNSGGRLMIEPRNDFFNTMLGEDAGGDLTSSAFTNTLIGSAAGLVLSSGSQNVFLGTGAGESTTTGDRNTYIGRWAGQNATGSSNVFLGAYTGTNEAGSNKLYIDNSSTTVPLIYGEFNTNLLRFGGSVQLGTWGIGDPGNDSTQLLLSGAFNDGVNNGTVDGTYKLKIEGYNNDGPVIYPIHVSDENSLVDFYIKNRAAQGGVVRPTMYFAGKVGIGTEQIEADLHVVGNDTLGRLIVAPKEPTFNHDSEIFLAEDINGNYGMKIKYDGGDNYLQIFGESNSTVYGPHFSMQRTSGQLALGTTDFAAGYQLSVGGKIACEEVLVSLEADWPDYVFKSDYELKTLAQVKQHIDEKGHLPGVPSAQEVAEEGLSLGEMNKVLMEKVEELTLYILQQEEKINSQEKQFEARLSVLESLIK